VIAYWIERFPPAIFLPAAASIALAAHSTAAIDLSRWLTDTIVSILLLAQFRLWDDLADRDRDRRTHPDRVIAKAPRISPFVGTCVALAVVNASLAATRGGEARVEAFLLLTAAAAAWYRWRPVRRTVASDLALLAKYPAFVVVIATGLSAPLSHAVPAAMAIYAAAVGVEIWHDPSCPLRFTNS
jgi:4-hydroxybenzoate polyprenyltransferase